jgi:hypothetical protein
MSMEYMYKWRRKTKKVSWEQHKSHMNYPGTDPWPSLREICDCRMKTPALTCAKLLIQTVNVVCMSRSHVKLDTCSNLFWETTCMKSCVTFFLQESFSDPVTVSSIFLLHATPVSDTSHIVATLGSISAADLYGEPLWNVQIFSFVTLVIESSSK